MAVQRGSTPNRAQIANAMSAELRALCEEKFDEFIPTKSCWACGRRSNHLERAHIVPFSANGSLDPTNFFLLCSGCHRHQPDNASPEAQMLWLKEHPASWIAIWHKVSEIPVALRQRAVAAVGEEFADRLLGAWMRSLGQTQDARQVAINRLLDGCYPDAGAGLFENVIVTAKYEMLIHFERFVAVRSRECLCAALSEEINRDRADQGTEEDR